MSVEAVGIQLEEGVMPDQSEVDEIEVSEPEPLWFNKDIHTQYGDFRYCDYKDAKNVEAWLNVLTQTLMNTAKKLGMPLRVEWVLHENNKPDHISPWTWEEMGEEERRKNEVAGSIGWKATFVTSA